jgi:uncharacterized protein
MLIGLISDTHIREPVQALPGEITETFSNVDLILHAGDIFIPSVLDELEKIAPVLAVCGDDDTGAVLKDQRVKTEHILNLEGHKLRLVHIIPAPRSLHPHQGEIKIEQPGPDSPDVIVFGHTHYSLVKRVNGVLLVNPGSPFNYSCQLGTLATLDLTYEKVQVNLVDLSKLKTR